MLGANHDHKYVCGWLSLEASDSLDKIAEMVTNRGELSWQVVLLEVNISVADSIKYSRHFHTKATTVTQKLLQLFDIS